MISAVWVTESFLLPDWSRGARIGDNVAMALDERAFFTEKPEMRTGSYQCPRCKRTGDYSVKWVRRTRRDRPPQGADERDRAKFAKLRDYVLRVDDEVTCKTCSKRFEIPSMNSLVFVDQLVGLPDEAALEREIAAASGDDTPPPAAKPALPARFTRKPTGWK
jgi:DNA-directed RNA polymerase subunit RPC12/RpoP